jgi:flagellar brake protein
MPAPDESASPPQGRFTEEEKRFLVDSRFEIAHILQNAVDRALRVTAHYSPTGFVMTSFVAVEPDLDRLVFELPPEPGQAVRLTSSGAITFMTNQDGIRIKFYAEGAWETTHEGRPALVSRLPQALVRLQRREYFRVICPMESPPTCVIPFATQGPAQKAETVVIDLSLGGILLRNSRPELNLKVGDVHKDCIVSLPEVGSFTTAIEVCTAHEVTLKNGTVTFRSGCRFVDPPSAGLTKVQLYTMMLERRNAKFGGT